MEESRTVYREHFENNYAICLKADNYPVGYINVCLQGSYDFGYGHRKEFWRKGIVTEAAA